MTDKKKTWIEPELIVIVRNRPEEAVLSGCKTSEHTGTVDGFFASCGQDCAACNDMNGS